MSCGVNAIASSNRKSLIHKITSSGWREDKSVWHCTSQCASSIDEASSKVWKTTTAGMSLVTKFYIAFYKLEWPFLVNVTLSLCYFTSLYVIIHLM